MLQLPREFRYVTFDDLTKGFIGVALGKMIYKHLGMTEFEVKSRIHSMENRGLVKFAMSPQNDPCMFSAPIASFAVTSEYLFAQKLVNFWDKRGEFDAVRGQVTVAAQPQEPFRPALPPHGLPHWQVALDQKINAIKSLTFIEKMGPGHPLADEVDWMGLVDDLTALRIADVYSFNTDTMHAILTGAESIPHESALSSVEFPSARAGWFWFAEPLPVTSSPIASEKTAALLWSWEHHGEEKKPVLRFSAYVIDTNTDLAGSIVPSTKWLWPLEFSFHDMIGLNTELYRRAYGPGGKFAGQQNRMGQEATLMAVASLSLFFLMSCVWFKQTVTGAKPVLTQEPGHIERHARKRYQKELKLDAPPTVRVVALRKTAAVPVEPSETTGEAQRHLSVRFVVSGHTRLQACGPERKDRKLIWISPFTKGPADAPFKATGPKVFAVVR